MPVPVGAVREPPLLPFVSAVLRQYFTHSLRNIRYELEMANY